MSHGCANISKVEDEMKWIQKKTGGDFKKGASIEGRFRHSPTMYHALKIVDRNSEGNFKIPSLGDFKNGKVIRYPGKGNYVNFRLPHSALLSCSMSTVMYRSRTAITNTDHIYG